MDAHDIDAPHVVPLKVYLGVFTALMVLTAIVSVSVIVFGLAMGFAVALAAYMLARLARRITEPLWLTWLNRNIEDSSVRATVTSMVNQTNAIGEVAGGPGVGVVGTVVSLRAALVQQLEMAADCRLRKLQCAGEFAHTQFLAVQQPQNAQPNRIIQRAKPLQQRLKIR